MPNRRNNRPSNEAAGGRFSLDGAKLRRLRRERGLSQPQLAAAAGMRHRQYIGVLEAGTHRVMMRFAIAFAAALRCALTDLAPVPPRPKKTYYVPTTRLRVDGAELRRRREARGLSQRGPSAAAGNATSGQHIGAIEKGVHRVKPAIVRELAAALECRPADLTVPL